MPIVFSAVASDRNIVSNFASCDGNFTEIAEQVLSKLPACNNKMTYSHGVYLLHYIAEDNYLYFCITDKLCQRSRAFLFLNEIQRRFITSKQTDHFSTTLAAEMYRYSEDYSTIVIRKGELDELNSIGVGCSESLLGEKILYINNPDVISYSTISHVSATPGHYSVSGVCATSKELPTLRPTAEKISVVTPDSNVAPVEKQTTEKRPIANTDSEDINIVDSAKQDRDLRSSPERTNPTPIKMGETITSLSPPPYNKAVSNQKFYVVIIGMMILVIALSIYAFGPISCVVVTSVGMYSLLRSYMGTKHKSD